MATISDKGLALIMQWEGCRLAAYRDSAGIFTVGFGATWYPDGRKVQAGDTLTQQEAVDLLHFHANRFAQIVDTLTTDAISQDQLDALTCLTFNIGEIAYKGSTLRQRINANPKDVTIRDQFMRWSRSKGRRLPGLWMRRHDEADLFMGVKTPVPPFPKESP